MLAATYYDPKPLVLEDLLARYRALFPTGEEVASNDAAITIVISAITKTIHVGLLLVIPILTSTWIVSPRELVMFSISWVTMPPILVCVS